MNRDINYSLKVGKELAPLETSGTENHQIMCPRVPTTPAFLSIKPTQAGACYFPGPAIAILHGLSHLNDKFNVYYSCSMSQMRKQKHREFKQLVQSHTAFKRHHEYFEMDEGTNSEPPLSHHPLVHIGFFA